MKHDFNPVFFGLSLKIDPKNLSRKSCEWRKDVCDAIYKKVSERTYTFFSILMRHIDNDGYIPLPYVCYGTCFRSINSVRRAVKVLEGRGYIVDHHLNLPEIKALLMELRIKRIENQLYWLKVRVQDANSPQPPHRGFNPFEVI